MMCEECGVRPATIHLTTIRDGEKTERNLCTVCMAKYQKRMPGMDMAGLAGILGGLIGAKKPEGRNENFFPEEDAEIDLTCPECGMTYQEFKKTGLLGCANCYQEFREPLETVLTRMHGSTRHTGRMPEGAATGISIRINIDRMRQQLAQAIANEEYEEAAQLRDKIRALTQQLESGRVGEEA